MFIDSRTVQDGQNIQCNICIIGAGAAGISIAREFLGTSTKICLLESGDFNPEVPTQDLYKGENTGLPYFPLDTTRLRFFGGTTNHWAGYNRPFSDWDFTKRPWIPNSGWPINRSVLDPYYNRAADLLGLPKKYWDLKLLEEKLGEDRIPFNKFATEVNLIKPVRMGQTYRDVIEKSSNVSAYLNANVLSLSADEHAKTITNVSVGTLSGRRFSVKADFFVLAAGGIENPRILLLSNSVQEMGLGNQNGLVGRYFMDHPLFHGAMISPARKDFPLQIYGGTQRPPKIGVTRVVSGIILSKESQQKRKIVASGIRLLTVPAKQRDESIWDKFARHVDRLTHEFSERSTPEDQRLIYTNWPAELINVHIGLDPVPNPDSRVTLSDDVDALGLRRVRMNWQLTDLDLKSARETLEIMGAEVARTGLGRLKSLLHDTNDGWPEDMVGAHHHMGTTRMADNPMQGVVDTNCKVFGISNLYMAGSSIFPTAGLGSPTLMIIALATRLADHLKENQNV